MQSPSLQLGTRGFHDYWLNETNAWIIPEWSRAGRAMVERCSRGVGSEVDLRLLHQAGRELLLAQSSDWSFILRAGTTTELAKERIERHLQRFWRLMAAIEGQEDLPEGWLDELEREDALFPLIQPADWARVSPQPSHASSTPQTGTRTSELPGHAAAGAPVGAPLAAPHLSATTHI